MRTLSLLILLTVIVFSSCKQSSSSQEAVKPDHTIINSSDSETLTLLQGRWRNTTDLKNTMVIDGNTKKEEYEGMPVTNVSLFELDNRCINLDMPSQKAETDKYIIIENVCLYIKELNETNLVIANAESGNFLIYERIK